MIIDFELPLLYIFDYTMKVEELLNIWKDEQTDVSNLRGKMIAILQKNQRAECCSVLIAELAHRGRICGTPTGNAMFLKHKTILIDRIYDISILLLQ